MFLFQVVPGIRIRIINSFLDYIKRMDDIRKEILETADSVPFWIFIKKVKQWLILMPPSDRPPTTYLPPWFRIVIEKAEIPLCYERKLERCKNMDPVSVLPICTELKNNLAKIRKFILEEVESNSTVTRVMISKLYPVFIDNEFAQSLEASWDTAIDSFINDTDVLFIWQIALPILLHRGKTKHLFDADQLNILYNRILEFNSRVESVERSRLVTSPVTEKTQFPPIPSIQDKQFRYVYKLAAENMNWSFWPKNNTETRLDLEPPVVSQSIIARAKDMLISRKEWSKLTEEEQRAVEFRMRAMSMNDWGRVEHFLDGVLSVEKALRTSMSQAISQRMGKGWYTPIPYTKVIPAHIEVRKTAPNLVYLTDRYIEMASDRYEILESRRHLVPKGGQEINEQKYLQHIQLNLPRHPGLASAEGLQLVYDKITSKREYDVFGKCTDLDEMLNMKREMPPFSAIWSDNFDLKSYEVESLFAHIVRSHYSNSCIGPEITVIIYIGTGAAVVVNPQPRKKCAGLEIIPLTLWFGGKTPVWADIHNPLEQFISGVVHPAIHGNHANTLFVNHVGKTIIRIEPNGAEEEAVIVDIALQDFFKKDRLCKDYKYIHIESEECPSIGIQRMLPESSGDKKEDLSESCQFLSNLLALLKLVCVKEKLSLKQITDKILSKYGKKSLSSIVMAWINFNWIYITKHGIRDAAILLAQSGMRNDPEMQLWYLTADWSPFFLKLGNRLAYDYEFTVCNTRDA